MSILAEIDTLFWTRLFWSFLVGAIWVSAITVVAEKFGSKVGGFIGGLPSTIVVALFFIGLSQDLNAAREATTLIPLQMGINGVFIVTYLATVRFGLFPGLGSALAVWALLTSLVIIVGFNHFPASLMIWGGLLVFSFLMSEKGMTIHSKGGIRVPYTPAQIATRGIISGLIISFAVLIGRLSGPLIGGIFSTFPVIFMSTLFITHRTGGREFSRAVAKTLMLSGMINVVVYAVVSRYAFQVTGLVAGSLIAMIVSMLFAGLTYQVIRRQTL